MKKAFEWLGVAGIKRRRLPSKMEEATSDYRHAFDGPIRDVTVPLQPGIIQIVLAEELTEFSFIFGLITFMPSSTIRPLKEF